METSHLGLSVPRSLTLCNVWSRVSICSHLLPEEAALKMTEHGTDYSRISLAGISFISDNLARFITEDFLEKFAPFTQFSFLDYPFDVFITQTKVT